MSKRLAIVSISVSWCCWAATSAQAQPAVVASAQQDEGLSEIVVTAQRRSEDVQHAAIAISTVSGDLIKNANITRPEGLTNLVPALQATNDTGPYSIFYVRGVGNFAANGLSDAALLFNFDGVTVSRSGTSGFFYDLERVEVLKGPQGTLYGRNATGGAINVISKAPVLNDFGVDASLDMGNYASNREDAMVNLPLGPQAAARIAVFHVQHDGYMKDGTDSQDDSGARASFLYVPLETLKFSVVFDYFKQGGLLAGGTVTGITSSFTNPPPFSASDRLGFFSPQVAAYISTQKDFLNGANFLPFQNVNYENNEFYGITPTIEWTTPIGTLSVIPAYRDSRPDYTSFATGVMLREQSHEEQTSVETRLVSNTSGPLKYVVGLYYLHDPDEVPVYDVNQQANATFQDYTTSTTSKAVFTNLTYNLTPDLRMIAGARYTKDDKDFIGTSTSNTIICTQQTPFGPSCPQAGVIPYSQRTPLPPYYFNPNGTIMLLTAIHNNESATYDKVTWRVGPEWDITDHNMVYASAETGFKSGGFFFTSDTGVYQPETIKAYTIGSKNRFLDNRLQANLELFYWKYNNQQISHLSTDSNNDTIFPTENVGEATYKGFELDLGARPLQNTLLSADVQYNDGVYDSFVYHTPNNNGGVSNGTGCPNGAPPGNTYTVDCSGKQPPYAPRWSVSAAAQQTIPLPLEAKLVGNARVHYQSETLTALEFLPVEQQAGYAMWDFDVTYSTQNDRFYLGGYVNNAFDKTALSFSFPAPFSAFMTSTLQAPRTYGIRVGTHF